MKKIEHLAKYAQENAAQPNADQPAGKNTSSTEGPIDVDAEDTKE